MSGYGLQGPSRSGWRDPRDTAYPDTGRNIESSRREGYYGGGYYQNGDGSGTGALEAPFSQQQGWGSKDAGPSVTRDESRPMEGYGSSMSNIQRRPSAGSQMQSSHASFRQRECCRRVSRQTFVRRLQGRQHCTSWLENY